jgi:DNA-binding MarR family transcriptional regulator
MDYIADNHASLALSESELSELAEELRLIEQLLDQATTHSAPGDRLRPQRYSVLAELGRGGSRRMSELAAISRVSQTSLTGIIDRLDERGLIERVQSPTDRRAIDVSITAAGVAVLERARIEIANRLGVILSPLSELQRREFLTLLRLITQGRHGIATEQDGKGTGR